MAYIPDSHKKYNLLPRCSKDGGEVFSYPSEEDEISRMLPDGESVIPYGYKSYAELYDELDRLISAYGTTKGLLNEVGYKLADYKNKIRIMNIKENWSVLRYLGESNFSFTHGQCYYWPCSIENPVYEGVIDNEEFTSYLAIDISGRVHTSLDTVVFKDIASTSSEWEILEDPTGMAFRTLSGKLRNLTTENTGDGTMC